MNPLTKACFLLMFTASLACAETNPAAKIVAWREMAEHWRRIEPELFTAAGSKHHLGEWVRFQGTLISRGSPLVVRLASGAIARVTHLNKADREFLASFRKPPTADVQGILRAVDPATHTVTIQSIGTWFGQ